MDEFCNEFGSVLKGDRSEGWLVFTYTTFYHQITRFFSTYNVAG